MDGFIENLIVNVAVNAYSVVQGQTNVEGEALEVPIWVEVCFLSLWVDAIGEHFVDGVCGFQIYNRQVRLCGDAIQGGGSGFASSLHTVVPWGCTQSKALSGRDDLVKRISKWS